MTFPSDNNVLSNPNIFIGKTGAICHSSFDDGGAENIRVPKSNCGTKVGKKGAQVKTKKIVNIRGSICDRCGNTLNDAALQNVKMSKDNAFNLFGMGKTIKEGWELGGNHNKGFF